MKTLVAFPGFTGGTNWGGTAADTKLGYIFLTEGSGRGGLDSEESESRTTRPGAFTIAPRHRAWRVQRAGQRREREDGRNWPCQKPPWARLIAVHANTGDIRVAGPSGVMNRCRKESAM